MFLIPYIFFWYSSFTTKYWHVILIKNAEYQATTHWRNVAVYDTIFCKSSLRSCPATLHSPPTAQPYTAHSHPHHLPCPPARDKLSAVYLALFSVNEVNFGRVSPAHYGGYLEGQMWSNFRTPQPTNHTLSYLIVAKASDGQRYPCPAGVVCD